MVQRPFSDRAHRRANKLSSRSVVYEFDDETKNFRRASQVMEGAAETESADWRRTQVEITPVNAHDYRRTSGEMHQVMCEIEGQIDNDRMDTTSEGEQTHCQRRAGRHGRVSKIEKGGHSFHLPLPYRERRPAMKKNLDDDDDEDDDDNNDDDNDDDDDDDNNDGDYFEGGENEIDRIRVDQLDEFYWRSFRSINQSACKRILKAWIRKCHPKKQNDFPYNGSTSKRKQKKSDRIYGYLGHYSKPDYWPSDNGWRKSKYQQYQGGVRHREPDHIGKEERLILLPHLLRSQNKGFTDANFCIDKLERSTKHLPRELVKFLKQIYQVRRKELAYERGEIDGNTLVPVRKPSKFRRRSTTAVKSAVNAARSVQKQVKKRPQPADPALLEDEDLDLSNKFELDVLEGMSSLNVDASPDASNDESTSRKPRHGLRRGRIQKNGHRGSANRRQRPAMFTNLNLSGYVEAPDGSQPNLQSRDLNPRLPLMADFSRHDIQRQIDPQAASQMVVNQAFYHSPPPQPTITRMDYTYNPAFSASSSGLAGWQPNNHWDSRPEPMMYPTITDENAARLPATSGYDAANLPSSLQPLENWNMAGGYQMAGVPPYPGNNVLQDPLQWPQEQQYQAPFGLQAFNPPEYQYYQQPQQSLGIPTPPPEIQSSPQSPSQYPTYFCPYTLYGTDNTLDPRLQGPHRQL